MTKISIIIINYNGRNYLEECLRSLYIQHGVNPLDYEILLVDNGSNDSSVEFVKMHFKKVRIVINKSNLGHAKACNIGARNALGDILVFVDNDTIFDKNWLTSLIDLAQSDAKIGVVGCKVLHYGTEKLIQEIGIQKDKFGFAFPYHEIGEIDHGQYDIIKKVFYCSSCSLLIKKIVFDLINGFDEDFFVHEDDFDLCWRAWLAGYNVSVNPFSVVFHKKGGTTGGGSGTNPGKYKTKAIARFYGERNILCTLLKNYALFTLIVTLPQYFSLITAEFLMYVLTGNYQAANSLISAILWNINQLPNTLNKRMYIQSNRKINDYEIKKMMIKGISKWKMFQRIGLPKFE